MHKGARRISAKQKRERIPLTKATCGRYSIHRNTPKSPAAGAAEGALCQTLCIFVVLLVVLVLAPVVPLWLRKRDFDRQVRGPRPERKAGEKDGLRCESRDTAEAEALAGQARLKSMQNINGGMRL